MTKEEILHRRPLLNHTLNTKIEKEIFQAMQEYADGKTDELLGSLKRIKELTSYQEANEMSALNQIATKALNHEYADSLTSQKDKEIERLKGLMKKLYTTYNKDVMFPGELAGYWKQFEIENNL